MDEETCPLILYIQKLNGLKKNQTTPRPSEHPPVMGEKTTRLVNNAISGWVVEQIVLHYSFIQYPYPSAHLTNL